MIRFWGSKIISFWQDLSHYLGLNICLFPAAEFNLSNQGAVNPVIRVWECGKPTDSPLWVAGYTVCTKTRDKLFSFWLLFCLV